MDDDPKYDEAVKAVKERGRASAVVIQRALGIGYVRAVALLDRMTANGVLGPDRQDGSRAILT